MILKTVLARDKALSEEKQFQTIFENASSVMIVTDEKGVILRINQTGLHYNKMRKGLNTGCRFGDIFGCVNTPNSKELCETCENGSECPCGECLFRKYITDTLNTGREYRNKDIKLLVQRGEEQKESFLLVSTSLLYSGGEKQCLIMVEDITNLKLANERLKRSESLLTETEELSKIGGWQYDLKTEKSYWTEGLYGIHEIPNDPAIDHIAESLNCYLPKDRNILLDAFTNCKEKGVPYDLEFPFITYKKKHKWVRTKTRAVYENGEIVKVIGTLLDITEEKRTKQELIKAKEIAEEADSVKSKFLANMSHEMRTPLNGILGMLNLINKEDFHPEIKMMLDMAILSAENMFNIVKDLLDLSHIELGKMALRKEDFDFVSFARYAVTMMDPQAKEKNIELKLSIGQDSIDFYGDKTRVTQILLNLISNAIKYSDKGTVEVLVDYHDDGNLVLMVSDEGIGIPEERLGEIFSIFQQLEDPYTKIHGGIGAGLSIVKSLVTMMDGEISVQSKVGVGSVFEVVLPNKEQPVQKETVHEEIPLDKINNAEKVIKKILIVEDESTNRMYVKTVLQLRGYEVIEAKNGLEAIEKNMVYLPDLIFMDIGLPLLNGAEATKQIRQNERFKDLPIIAVTAHVSDDAVAQFLEAGLSDVIAKPYKEKDLFKSIANYSKSKL